MRHTLPSLLLALAAALAIATTAAATPQPVHVRVEGKTTTIFDATVLADGHPIKSLSDSETRTCDTTNLGHTSTPQVSATSAAVDAMATLGKSFDGQWYNGYDDYFITQFADDHDSDADGQWWGILVDWKFTPVGGCQYPALPEDNVLWVYDAFSGKQFLKLNDGGSTKAVVGEPFSTEVVTVDTGDVDETHEGSETAHEGATVRAVNATGQDVTGVASTDVSDEDGLAVVTFSQTGWQRLKARELNTDAEDPFFGQNIAIASNSIDVCVVEDIADDCEGTPPSQQPLIPDDTPPSITIDAPADNSTTNQSTAALSFTATDDYGLAPSCNRSSGDVLPLELGANELSVSCTDAFGNSSTASVHITRNDSSVPPTDPTGPTGPSTPTEPAWTALAKQARCIKKCSKPKSSRATGGKFLRLKQGGSASITLTAGTPTLRVGPRAKQATLAVKIGKKTKLIRLAKGKGMKSVKLTKLKKKTKIVFSPRRGTIDLDAVKVAD